MILRQTTAIAARTLQLFAGLGLFGFSLALMVRAGLGLSAWDVLHQGLARRFGVPLGWAVIAVGAAVLVAWLPLRQRPGPGTVANVVVVGAAANGGLAVLPQLSGVGLQVVALTAGILANGLATGLYIGAGFGAGPRDGVMLGLARRGVSIRTARTVIELGVLAIGAVLGGTVGAGTLAYALSIGPLAAFFIARLSWDGTRRRSATARPARPRPVEEMACQISP